MEKLEELVNKVANKQRKQAEVLRNADLQQPQCSDLYTVLENVLAGDNEGVSLQPLHHLAHLKTGGGAGPYPFQ